MQKVPGRAPALLASLIAGLLLILPTPARAVTLEGSPSGPLCLSAYPPNPCNDGPDSLGFLDVTFDLSGLALPDGEIITGATLHLLLSDDFGQADGTEKISLVVGGVTLLYNADAGHDALIALADLSALGDVPLTVEISAARGDFFFGGAELLIETGPAPAGPEDISVVTNADVTTGVVPSPAPLLLMGLGVAALAWLRRTRA